MAAKFRVEANDGGHAERWISAYSCPAKADDVVLNSRRRRASQGQVESRIRSEIVIPDGVK